MGKFDGLLLVSDFDDTLYDKSCHIPERNLQALHYYIEQGGRFTIATGRAHTTFAPYVHLAPINAPVVLSNGSAIYDFETESMLLQTMLDDRIMEDLEALTAAEPELGFEAYHGEDIYVYRFNEITAGHMHKVGTGYTCCPIRSMPLPWTKVILQQQHPVLLRAQQWLAEHCPGRYEAIFSNRFYLELTDHGSNKGGMVAKLAQLLHIAPDRIYCVGDNQNDISMLELSAIPFAPANCAPELKQWGARLVCPCEEGAIGEIIDILDQIYK